MNQSQHKLTTSPIPGLILSLVLPAIYVLFIGPVLLRPALDEPLLTLISFGVLWLLAIGVLIYTRKIEHQPLSSLGWKPLSWKWVLIAIGIGILLSLLVPVFTLLVSAIFPPSTTGTITEVSSQYTWWILLLSTLTAGVTEEILFRGYPLERLDKLTGNRWLSALISLVCFVAIHAAGWNIEHIVGVVIPLGIALTGLYVWRRNVVFVMIIHILIDLPLVFMAL